MSFSDREFWALVHGIGLGGFFLLAFSGGLVGLWSYRPEWVTQAGMKELTAKLTAGTWIMAVVAWLTVISGSFLIYPWYRAAPPKGLTDLTAYPRYFLLANPELAQWHKFGMEWKEHIAWMAPILATAVAFVVISYGARLADRPHIRKALMVLFVIAFASAAIAGVFGALITKSAPIQ